MIAPNAVDRNNLIKIRRIFLFFGENIQKIKKTGADSNE
jgi:hypothetical protein